MYKIQALPGPENADSEAFGINSKGDVVGLAYPLDPQGQHHMVGVNWTGGVLSFALPLASESILYAVNGSDDAVGVRGFSNSPTEIAILANIGSLTDLPVGEGSIATGINDAGQVCGWSWNNPRAFIYNKGSGVVTAWIDPLPGAQQCGAACINDGGEVAGSNNDYRGFFYSAGSTKDLGRVAFVEGVNQSGVVCGSLGKPYPESFRGAICDARQASPAWVEIPLPAGIIGSHAQGINNGGDVVGTCWTQQTYNGSQSAYVYSGGVSTDLNTLISDPGWHLEFAERINNKGQISGTGTFYGKKMAFRLTPQGHVLPGVLTLPELIGIVFGGVSQDGGGWVWIGGHRIPIGPWGPWLEIPEAKRDALVALALDEIAMFLSDRGSRETVRRALIEVAKGRLDHLMHSVDQSRTGPGVAAGAGIRERALHNGKSVESLRRFRPQ